MLLYTIIFTLSSLLQSARKRIKEEDEDDDDKPLAIRKKVKTEPKEKKRKKVKDEDEDEDFKPVSYEQWFSYPSRKAMDILTQFLKFASFLHCHTLIFSFLFFPRKRRKLKRKRKRRSLRQEKLQQLLQRKLDHPPRRPRKRRSLCGSGESSSNI